MKKTACIVLLLLLSVSFLPADDSAKPSDVTISIAAEDKAHNAVPDLQASEVSLKDNGAAVVPKSVVYAGSAPKDWILLIDSSGSMMRTPLWRPAIEAAFKRLTAFMQERGDRVAIVTAQNDAWLDQDFTSDPKRVRAVLNNLDPRGATALYDGLASSADYLAKKRTPGRQQVLWVITDGKDNASNQSLQHAGEYISSTGIPTLFFLIGDEPTGMSTAQHLAKDSGGAVFRLTREQQCDEEATKLLDFAGKEYLITFSTEPDHTKHDIQVATSRGGISLLDRDRHIVTNGP